MGAPAKSGGLTGLRVLSLESRRAAEMAKLIENYGGRAIVAPAMREVPLESNTEALEFARTLSSEGFDVVIFLTGVGARFLVKVAESIGLREQFVGGASARGNCGARAKTSGGAEGVGRSGDACGAGAEHVARSVAGAG